MNDSKRVTEGAVLTAVYIIVLLFALYIPFLEFIFIFLLPIPFIIFASRHDWKGSIVMAVAALLFSFLILPGLTVPLTSLSLIGGIAIGTGIHKGWHAYDTWIAGTIGFSLGFVAVYAFIQYILGIDISGTLDDMIDQSLGMVESLGLGGQVSDDMYQLVEEQLRMIKDLIPAGIVVASILYAFISQWISYKILRRLDNKQLSFPSFGTFNLPISVIWTYFFAMIIGFFDLDQEAFLYIGVNNIMLVATLLLMIQGYSFIFFYADHKKWSVAIPIISIIAGFLIPVLFYLIVILGIIDLGFSLKHRIDEQKK